MPWTEITDDKVKRIFEALSGDNVTWRTLWGVAHDTGLSESEVEEILNKYPQYARKSDESSISGSALVGLVEKVGA